MPINESGDVVRLPLLRPPPSLEEIQRIFYRRRPGSAHPISSDLHLGGIHVHVQTTREIISNWLIPALGRVLDINTATGVPEFHLSIALLGDLMEIGDLAFWVGHGNKHGLYESIQVGGDFFVFEHSSRFLAYWSPCNRKAFVCLADLQNLAAWEHAAPIKAVIHGICTGTPMQLIHAGGVGRADGGVLLLGPGGSGKSTTALACLGSNLGYAADDYCLVDTSSQPVAYQLYTTAKLRPENIHRFESMRTRFRKNQGRLGDKPTIFLNEEDHFTNLRSFPVDALVLPKVTSLVGSSWQCCSAASAWRALAPSTMMQLPLCGHETFTKITSLTRNVPAYELHVGTDLSMIPICIEEILKNAQRSPKNNQLAKQSDSA